MKEILRQFFASTPPFLHLREIAAGFATSAMYLLATLPLILILEKWHGRDLSRHRSRNFAVDLLYRFLFIIYAAIIITPASVAIRTAFPVLDLKLLQRLPLWAGVVAYWLVFDLLAYWVHRFQHTRVWWRFHRIHHSQERMTFATAWRNHPIDQLLASATSMVPLIVLGAPAIVFLPYSFALSFIDAIHHANLRWTFGPMRKIFVSPVFHAQHHALDRATHDRNFGGLLSIWDFLFGTALDRREAPTQTGVEGWRVRESLWAHFVSPFRRDAIEPAAEKKEPGADTA